MVLYLVSGSGDAEYRSKPVVSGGRVAGEALRLRRICSVAGVLVKVSSGIVVNVLHGHISSKI